MDSNSMSESDKDGSVPEMEHGVTMSDIKEEVPLREGQEAGEDKPPRDETETPLELVTGEALKLDSNSGTDKEGSVAQAGHKVKVTMSEVAQGTAVGDRPTREEKSVVDVAQLVKARQEDLKLKQMARRAAWQEQVKAELDKRAEAKLRMERTPRSQITSGMDKQIFSKISVHARKTFRAERTGFLFNEVFPIISQATITRWNVTFAGILKSRLVSKAWKDAVDNSISAASAHYEDMFSSLDRHLIQFDHGCLQFRSANSLKMFNQKSKLEYRGSNPFPFRQLYIGSVVTLFDGSNVGLPYWIEMEKLLQSWGKEIWTALYVFDDGSIDMMYELLVKYLNLTPNLRELGIFERDRTQNVGADMLRSLGKDVLGPLKLKMERMPLPGLPHLRSISFGDFTPVPLFKAALTKYGDTLESVKMEGQGFDIYSGEYLDLGQFVAGRELPFRRYSCLYSDSFRITHWDFQFPALNELRLDYHFVNEGPEIENIFKTVNSVGSSVRRLRLKILFNVADPKGEKDWRDLLPVGIKLELPQLEWLNLTVERSKISNVDFLLPLVSLKELTMYYLTMGSDTPSKGGNGIIQFAGDRDRLYDSNIWTVLPEIKLLFIKTIPINEPSEKVLRLKETGVVGLEYSNMTATEHTRDGYRRHQSDQNGVQLLT